ncbi:hypothetical protein CALCODRAFT_128185 [Calocera cornea HHB12733]|uniref:Uncharacterized protein n=1 Tax=Calocera cornea HHB12733 TaxID=1353952 RepID=A0A165I9V7_9BASI|nr:hypothetical protein CALCODRAFT_128185 [Calocera cornea HHB12733]
MLAVLARPFLPSRPSLPSSSTSKPHPRPALRSTASLALLPPSFADPSPSSSSRPSSKHKRTQSSASCRSVKSSPTSPLAAADVQAQAVFDTAGMSASASLKSLSKVDSRGRGRRRGSFAQRKLPGNWTSESDDDIPPVPPLPRAGPSTSTAAGKYPAVPSLAHSSTSSLSSAVQTPTSPAPPGLPGSSPKSTKAISPVRTPFAPLTPARGPAARSGSPSTPFVLGCPRPGSRPRSSTQLPRPQKLNPVWAEMDPYLAQLEQKAKLVPASRCSVCTTKGKGFPACPRCGVEWCSRECRTEDLRRRGLKRHVCDKGKQAGTERVASVGLQAALVRAT